MKKFKTNLLIGLHATVIGLAISELSDTVNEYGLISAIAAIIITVLMCMGICYLIDGLTYLVNKIGGR